MRNYNEAMEYSKHNPTEVVEFKDSFDKYDQLHTGFLLNRKHEGLNEFYCNNILQHRDIYNAKTLHSEHLHFRSNGTISRHCFGRGCARHGECAWFNEDETVTDHYFYISGSIIKELDYLVNEPRDDAFYVTLALHGIDKEYTF